MGSVFFNKGENCIAAGRLFLEESIHDRFLERVVEEVKKMVIGDPLDRSTHHGPQNHRYDPISSLFLIPPVESSSPAGLIWKNWLNSVKSE